MQNEIDYYINQLIWVVSEDPYITFRTAKLIDKIIEKCYWETGHYIKYTDDKNGIRADGVLLLEYDFEW